VSDPRPRRDAHALWIAALATALCASAATAQSYGVGEQVLTIGMAGAPVTRTNFTRDDGYLYDTTFSELPVPFVLPLRLPDGAEVRGLCAYTNDIDGHGPTTISLVAVKLVPGGGGDPDVVTVPGSVVQTTTGAGYASYCTGSMSYTLQNARDLDGDSIPDNVAYYLLVQPGFHAGIGGVLVTWARQVSPPPDTPTFGDVPASDGAFAHIEALAASGITAGCGRGKFCPDVLLTRRQMAVYLARALGLHWAE
jgi:hypothetical protein